ncbi:hypothetical protein OUZ56_016463 [Daphnia magna]|uniref:Uncharacterized protein n=1 Tax=Daphnia magna TaxID=35525 RepID=A0ABR0AQN0_9CRUS|nr:hypothetical protein OUZ56_016463 [Daphnia magna]
MDVDGIRRPAPLGTQANKNATELIRRTVMEIGNQKLEQEPLPLKLQIESLCQGEAGNLFRLPAYVIYI